MTQAERPEERLLQSVELGMLCACYGGLLTQKQLAAVRLSCNEDLSLSEIAEEMGVSRQNVHELITRSVQKLRRYEGALHLARQTGATRARLQEAIAALDAGQAAGGKAILQQLLLSLDEEEAPDGI